MQRLLSGTIAIAIIAIVTIKGAPQLLQSLRTGDSFIDRLQHLALRGPLPSMRDYIAAAQKADPDAQNNLAVLTLRDKTAAGHWPMAMQTLDRLAKKGHLRAQLNLQLAKDTCDAGALEALAKIGEARAASFAADCLVQSWDDCKSVWFADRLVTLSKLATRDQRVDEFLKFGSLMVKLVTAPGGCRLDRAGAIILAEQAATLLHRAAHDHKSSAAYGQIELLARKHAGTLEFSNAGRVITAKTPEQWMQRAAEAGHAPSNCRLGSGQLRSRAASNQAKPSTEQDTTLRKHIDACLLVRRQAFGDAGSFEKTDKHSTNIYQVVWMVDPLLLLRSPEHQDYDYDASARSTLFDQHLRMLRTSQNGRSSGSA